MRVQKYPTPTTYANTWPNLASVPSGVVTEEMTAAEFAAWLAQQPPITQPEPSPESVTRRQMHRWLVKNGIPIDGIRARFDAMPEPDRSLALIDFEAATYEQTNPLLQSLAAQIGISVAQAFRGAALE